MISTIYSPVVVSSLHDVDIILCKLILEAYKDQDVTEDQIDSYNFFETIQQLHYQHVLNKDYTPIVVENTVFTHKDGSVGLLRVIIEFISTDNDTNFYDTTIKLAVVDFTEEEKNIFDKIYYDVIKDSIVNFLEEPDETTSATAFNK